METNTLIEFTNLRQVLEDFAQDFKQAYRAELTQHGRFTQYGQDRLVDSVDANNVSAMVQQGDRVWEVSIDLKHYWKYVEEGTRPHWPPPSAILRWVEIKPVVPRPDSRGRIPSPRSLAYLIGRKIAREGTTGSHDFKDAQTATIERFREAIKTALAKDFEGYIRKVVV